MNHTMIKRVAEWTRANPDHFTMKDWAIFQADPGDPDLVMQADSLADLLIEQSNGLACGSQMCIAGTAIYLDFIDRHPQHDRTAAWNTLIDEDSAHDRGAEILGLDEDESFALFMPSSRFWRDYGTSYSLAPATVADVLDKLADGTLSLT